MVIVQKMSANQKFPVMVWGQSQPVSTDTISFTDVMSEELAKELHTKYVTRIIKINLTYKPQQLTCCIYSLQGM